MGPRSRQRPRPPGARARSACLRRRPGVIVIGLVAAADRMDPRPQPLDPRVPRSSSASADSIVTNGVKALVDRARPAIDPVGRTLGPSFPSGHSSTAAAFSAALALLAGRRRRPAVDGSALAGVAVGLAVAVACSRVLLDLHWVSDVVGGLVLGWGWFAVCAIAFGGSLLRFGAPVEQAGAAAAPVAAARGGPSGPELPGTPAGRPRARGSAAAGGSRRPRRAGHDRSPRRHDGRRARSRRSSCRTSAPPGIATGPRPARPRPCARGPAAASPPAASCDADDAALRRVRADSGTASTRAGARGCAARRTCPARPRPRRRCVRHRRPA